MPSRAHRSRCVREPLPPYEEEGSQRSAHGAVPVHAGAWWSVSLHVPVDHASVPAAPVRVRLQRHGAPVSWLVDGVIEVHLPVAELDAVLVALQGVVAQARRDRMI